MRILLCCDGGFSTSIVVSKMMEAAKECGKEDYKIWAINVGSLKEHIAQTDVVLLGPHMMHKLKYVEEVASAHNVKVGVISGQDYSFGKGANVIAQAEKLLGGEV